MLTGESNDDDLKPDQQEQHRIEHFIHQFPKFVQAATGTRRHAEVALAIADQELGSDHANGGRYSQPFGQHIATRGECQGQQDLDSVFVDRAQQAIDDPAQKQAQNRAAQRLTDQQK